VRLLAKGRAADVYDLGDGTVLRRYRFEFDTAREAEFMKRVREAGLPVPRVVSASGSDLVMERIDGITMLDDLARRPWRLRAHADLLASLMRRLHEVPADGGQILHGDLHPLNVMLTDRGPVIIDWTGARIGPWARDVAMTWLIVGTSVPDDSAWQRALAAAGAGLFTRRFLSHFDLASVRAVLPEIAELRLRDPHVTAVEAARVRRLAGLSHS
jgi:aminoglycoside phosphotransferase (APT) family kinase protein